MHFRYVACALTLVVFVASAIVFAKSHGRNRTPIQYDERLLSDGDLIFRRGVSIESNVIMALDGGELYSHVGIISKHDDVVTVIHVVTDEPAGSPNITRAEPLEVFLGADRASAAAVYRIKSSESQYVSDASQTAAGYAAARIPFDADFDLGSADTLYCTELVWRAFQKAGLDLTDNKRDSIRTPLGSGQYLLPGTLLRSSHLQHVWTSTN